MQQQQRVVLGIDPGVRGMAWALCEIPSGKLVNGNVSDLCAGTNKNYYTLTDRELLNLIFQWWKSHRVLFKEMKPEYIILESQRVYQGSKHKGRMMLVLGILSTLCNEIVRLDRLVWKEPRQIKQAFGLCRGSHGANKEAVVAHFEQMERDTILLNYAAYMKLSPKQRSDLADAYFLSKYQALALANAGQIAPQ